MSHYLVTLPSMGDGGNPNAILLDEHDRSVHHKDIGQIAVTDLDGITINRTKTGISPFVPIIKTPTYSQNSGTHSGYSVEIEDPSTATGFRHVGNVSKNYLLLSNEEVRDLALEIARKSGMPFKESRIFWDGAKFCHIVDFQHREAEDLGGIGLSLITRSSYDKSWRYDCALMGKRFVCDNGALSGEFFARISFKHLSSSKEDAPRDETWQAIVRQGMSVIDHAPRDLKRFVEAMRTLKSARMTDGRLREVWKSIPTIGDSVKGQIVSRYVEKEEGNLFGLFQAGTWLFSHRKKMTAADFSNNEVFTTALLEYALRHQN